MNDGYFYSLISLLWFDIELGIIHTFSTNESTAWYFPHQLTKQSMLSGVSFLLLRKAQKIDTTAGCWSHFVLIGREIRYLFLHFPSCLRSKTAASTYGLSLPRPSYGCHLLRWGVWNSTDTLCMGGLLFTADKAKILGITWRYHITHKMELLLFSSKTYSVSPGQRKERTANHMKTEPIKDLCKPELLGFKLFSFFPLSFSPFFFNKRGISSWTAKLM